LDFYRERLVICRSDLCAIVLSKGPFRVVCHGKPVQIVHDNVISTIKPENISAYINFDDAELSAGDEAMFIFRPSLVNKYDEKESGLSALIIKKHDDNAIDNIEAETKAVKVLVNGQLMIIKNGKTYNDAGTLVK